MFYQVPLYRELAHDPRVALTVYYGSSGGDRPYDAEFGGRQIAWDVDLLGGYDSVYLEGAHDADVLGGFFAVRNSDAFRSIARGDHDVIWVHGYSYATLWLAMAAAWFKRRPVLLREEQTLLHRRSGAKRWVREAVLRVLFARVHGLYIGSNNRDYFRRYGVPERRLFFAPYCVNNEEFSAAAAALSPCRGAVRQEFGIEDDRPTVLFVGKLVEKKRPDVALEAFARVRARDDAALLIVGEGPLEPELRRIVERDEIPDVHFTGFLNRSEIAKAYVAADMLVLPSQLHETWGLVVNEAMNFGLPLVLSDKVGSGRDLVEPGQNGFVVPVGAVDETAAAIGGLVRSREDREAFGRRSREIVADWTYERAAAGIIEACQAALGGRGS